MTSQDLLGLPIKQLEAVKLIKSEKLFFLKPIILSLSFLLVFLLERLVLFDSGLKMVCMQSLYIWFKRAIKVVLEAILAICLIG